MSNKCKTDEIPGFGCYECTHCRTHLSIDEYDKLPPCPRCTNTEFVEI